MDEAAPISSAEWEVRERVVASMCCRSIDLPDRYPKLARAGRWTGKDLAALALCVVAAIWKEDDAPDLMNGFEIATSAIDILERHCERDCCLVACSLELGLAV